jgi:hypothetical protein
MALLLGSRKDSKEQELELLITGVCLVMNGSLL